MYLHGNTIHTLLNCLDKRSSHKAYRYPAMSCHVAVPSSTTLATMRCQSSLSSEALVSYLGLTLSFHDLLKLSSYFSLWRSFALLPSILSVAIKFFRPCLLSKCPRKASSRWRILFFTVKRTTVSFYSYWLLFVYIMTNVSYSLFIFHIAYHIINTMWYSRCPLFPARTLLNKPIATVVMHGYYRPTYMRLDVAVINLWRVQNERNRAYCTLNWNRLK